MSNCNETLIFLQLSTIFLYNFTKMTSFILVGTWKKKMEQLTRWKQDFLLWGLFVRNFNRQYWNIAKENTFFNFSLQNEHSSWRAVSKTSPNNYTFPWTILGDTWSVKVINCLFNVCKKLSERKVMKGGVGRGWQAGGLRWCSSFFPLDFAFKLCLMV